MGPKPRGLLLTLGAVALAFTICVLYARTVALSERLQELEVANSNLQVYVSSLRLELSHRDAQSGNRVRTEAAVSVTPKTFTLSGDQQDRLRAMDEQTRAAETQLQFDQANVDMDELHKRVDDLERKQKAYQRETELGLRPLPPNP